MPRFYVATIIISIIVTALFSNVWSFKAPLNLQYGPESPYSMRLVAVRALSPVSRTVALRPLFMGESENGEQIGKTRRILRSIAARMMRNESENPGSPNKLTILSINQMEGIVDNQPFIENMSQQLKAKAC